MPKVLNCIGVQAAVFGNHEFDWGLPRAQELCSQCGFPWLMSNCTVKATGDTLGGGERTVLFEHSGIKVGLMGLIEREWLATLSTIDESELSWRDDIEVAKELAAELRGKGAEVVIALTHSAFAQLPCSCTGLRTPFRSPCPRPLPRWHSLALSRPSLS